MNPEVSSKIAQYLLEAKAVKLSPETPFTWASGWKSPIYCDNRVTLSFPHIRSFIKQSLAATIKEHFPDAEILVGVATAGIAIGALAADELNLPYAYAQEAVLILDRILADEVGHVAIGNHWFHTLCRQRGVQAEVYYHEAALLHKAPTLKPPFNISARRAAGFSEAELAALPV